MTLISKRNTDVYDIIKARYSVKQRRESRGKLFNFLHTKMLQKLAKLYEFNTEDNVHFLFYQKQKRYCCKIVVIREFRMSRGSTFDLKKVQTRMDIVHAKLIQTLNEAKENIPVPRLEVNQDYNPSVEHDPPEEGNKHEPPEVNNFQNLITKWREIARKEYSYILFAILLLILIPILDNVYYYLFKSVELTLWQKILKKFYEILNKFYPSK